MRSHAAREDWEDGNGGQAGLVIAWWKLPFLRTERVPPALIVFPVCARLFFAYHSSHILPLNSINLRGETLRRIKDIERERETMWTAKRNGVGTLHTKD